MFLHEDGQRKVKILKIKFKSQNIKNIIFQGNVNFLPDVSPGQLSHNKYQLKAFTLLSVVTDILVLSRILERSSLSSLGLPSLIIPAVSSLTKTINNSNNKIKVELYN